MGKTLTKSRHPNILRFLDDFVFLPTLKTFGEVLVSYYIQWASSLHYLLLPSSAHV